MRETLTTEQREEMIQALVLRTGWNASAIDKLSDDKLQKLYDERM